jgi:hypothetical protein
MILGIKLGNVMIDSKDDLALCSFYQQLLGWQRDELYGCPALISENGMVFLFMWERGYLPPVWPEEPGCQQKQMHFDFRCKCAGSGGLRGIDSAREKPPNIQR